MREVSVTALDNALGFLADRSAWREWLMSEWVAGGWVRETGRMGWLATLVHLHALYVHASFVVQHTSCCPSLLFSDFTALTFAAAESVAALVPSTPAGVLHALLSAQAFCPSSCWVDASPLGQP